MQKRTLHLQVPESCQIFEISTRNVCVGQKITGPRDNKLDHENDANVATAHIPSYANDNVMPNDGFNTFLVNIFFFILFYFLRRYLSAHVFCGVHHALHTIFNHENHSEFVILSIGSMLGSAWQRMRKLILRQISRVVETNPHNVFTTNKYLLSFNMQFKASK